MPRSFKVNTFFGTETCTLSAGKYADNKHIALQLWCAEGPFATLTVNLRETRSHPGNYAFVDTNNAPWAESLIKRLKIGKPTGKWAHSGFCAYPLYEFDLEKVKWYTGKAF